MKRHSLVMAAILAIASAGFAQDHGQVHRIEVTAPPAVEVIDLDDMDNDEVAISLAPAMGGSVILGVEGQDADADKKQDDGTIVKEIDLGDGRRMKIVITTSGKSDGAKGARKHAHTWFGSTEAPKAVGPDGKTFKFDFKGLDPQGFDVRAFRGEVRENMERALKAFDSAREAFIRAYQDHDGKADGAHKHPGVIARKLFAPKIVIDDDGDEKKREPRADRAEKAERPERPSRKHDHDDVSVLRVTPGAAAQNARDVEALRKEIKELERMVRDLKKQIDRKD